MRSEEEKANARRRVRALEGAKEFQAFSPFAVKKKAPSVDDELFHARCDAADDVYDVYRAISQRQRGR